MRIRYQRAIWTILILAAFSSCSVDITGSDLSESQDGSKLMSFSEAPSIPDLVSGRTRTLTPDQLANELDRAGEEWFYGHGFGRTAVNVTGVVIFPPYAFYLIGNAGLEMLGLGSVYPSDVLPDKPREQVEGLFSEFVSVPGRINAAVAGREFVE